MGLINTRENISTSISTNFLLHVTTKIFADFLLCPTEQDTFTLLGFCKHMVRMIYDEDISDAVIDNLTGRNNYSKEYKEKYNNQLTAKEEMFNYFSIKMIQE